jgi:hypothetical protein
MKGALIFAFNNEKLDYFSMARWSAGNINRHLGIPTAIVTNQPFTPQSYERCITVEPVGNQTRQFHDVDGQVTWYNSNRVDAFKLSPWEQTLVLDADYVVASDMLTSVIEVEHDFVAHKTAYDITSLTDFEDHNTFGRNQMPMWWATVMFFNRSQQAKSIFDCMHMIRENWEHYRHLFGVARSTYRNDFALSIALGIVNGHTLDHADIPWKLPTVNHIHKLSMISRDRYRVDFVTADNRTRWVEVTGDFHAMGKRQLGDIIDSTC